MKEVAGRPKVTILVKNKRIYVSIFAGEEISNYKQRLLGCVSSAFVINPGTAWGDKEKKKERTHAQKFRTHLSAITRHRSFEHSTSVKRAQSQKKQTWKQKPIKRNPLNN